MVESSASRCVLLHSPSAALSGLQSLGRNCGLCGVGVGLGCFLSASSPCEVLRRRRLGGGVSWSCLPSVPQPVLRPRQVQPQRCPCSSSPLAGRPVVITELCLGSAVNVEMIEYQSASSAVPPMALGCILPEVSESACSASPQLVYTLYVI